jgi:beta-lactamase regulating signal transducer with metallopeptidase domain
VRDVAILVSDRAGSESSEVSGRWLGETTSGDLRSDPAAHVAAGQATLGNFWANSSTNASADSEPSYRVWLALWLVFSSWLLGAACVAIRQARSIDRLWRIAIDSRPAPKTLVEEVTDVAARLHVRTLPVFVTTEIATPFVLCLLKLRLLWPDGLCRDPHRYRGAIAHELAHVKRRDHWVRCLELAVCCIWWWNPVFWFARRRLRESAEIACDAVALATVPERRREYAELFLELCQGARPAGGAMLALGVSARSRRSIKRRLSMILSDNVSPRTSTFGFGAALMLACVALPTWSLGQVEDTERNPQTTTRSDSSETDRDSDGDGLSDYQELHKYRTDPKTQDSDGDGTPDGDWEERREYSYTVRSILRVMPPCGKGNLSDDYQDARIRKETDEYVELEVTHYPLATSSDGIEQNPKWQRDSARMIEYLKPRLNTNWDEKMRDDLLGELQDAGIRVDKLADKQVVEQLSNWFVGSYKDMPLFNALHVHYPQGRIAVLPGRERSIYIGRDDWTVQDEFEHELLGRSMFYNKTRGSCTSSAMGLTTVLRAVGIPTRMVLAIPIVDGSDEQQVAMLQKLRHHQVRKTALDGVSGLGNAFASHTFNEVYVGGRWHRLNYNRLGQSILDRHMFGLVTHIHTFNDLSEWGLQPTWGKWNATGRKTKVFAHNNPYATVAVTDQFGVHAKVPNPPVKETRLTHFTISKAYWFDSADRPRSIPADSVEQDGSGHVLVHVDEKYDGDFRRLYRIVRKQFVLKAQGQSDVPALAERGYWGTEFYLRIRPNDLTKVAKDVPYKLTATDSTWKIKPDVTIVKRRQASVSTEERQELTISSAYWFHSSKRPKTIRPNEVAEDGDGHLLAVMNGDMDRKELAQFYRDADKQFVLKGDGQSDVPARAERGYWGTNRGIEFYLRIRQPDLSKMTDDVPYALVASNSQLNAKWIIKPAVKIVK